MIYLPTSGEDRRLSLEIFTNTSLQKGQLYNLDLNEYLGFQFNPTTFEWSRDINWSEQNWVGGTRGGDLQFISLGPRLIELELLYIVDPRAPKVSYESDFAVIDPKDELVDFQAIRSTIEKWEELLDGIRRPSRVKIIVGPNGFEGVITSSTFRITEFFEDLTAKEALFLLEFREWQPL